MKSFLPWILLFLAAEGVLGLIQFALRKRGPGPAGRFALIALKLVLAVAFAGLVMGGPVFLRPVQIPLVAAYAALLPDAAADLIGSLWCLIRRRERSFGRIKLLSLLLGLAFFTYGTLNMQIVRPHYLSFSSDKLTREHRLVFVSDLHVGSAQSFETTRKTIESIRAERPDFVILGGDITDDYTPAAEMEETYRLFGSLGVPVYYIDGNHEVVQHARYLRGGLPYTARELTEAIERSGVTILRDDYVELAPDLFLLGREDAAAKDERLPEERLPDPAPGRFLLVADHQPGSFPAHRALGADLQLSGHTHAGQLFPLRWLESPFMKVLGEYRSEDGGILYVSAGACGWRAPFRTEAGCRFEVVTLLPSGQPAPAAPAGEAGALTDEQALSAIRNYCLLRNPDLEELVNDGDYPVYWEIDSSSEEEIVVLFRAYTGAQIRYHIDPVSGETSVTEFVPGVSAGEERTDESFNVRDYADG